MTASSTEPLIPNRLRDERLAAGIDTAEQLAARADIDPAWYRHIEAGDVLPTVAERDRLSVALGGIPADRIWAVVYLEAIGGSRNQDYNVSPSQYYQNAADRAHMLVARDEISWFDRQPGSDHRADVFMNLSCGTQYVPHLLLDTVAVLEALEVDFVAAAGPTACCGKAFLSAGRPETAERLNLSRVDRSVQWGAHTHVNWCTSCQSVSTVSAARRRLVDDVDHPVREVQVLTFLEERVRELGDRMPWRKDVPCRVVVEGHVAWGAIPRDAQQAAARLLAMIPGVEVVGLYDGWDEANNPCVAAGRGPDYTPPPWQARQNSVAGIREHRNRLAAEVRARGADTVSCQQQSCHVRWSPYATPRLAVRHAVSILAEALGCAHPDRYQAAIRLGDPEQFVEQTRPVWESWNMPESRAGELARVMSDPKFADETARRSCGHGDCGACKESRSLINVLSRRP